MSILAFMVLSLLSDSIIVGADILLLIGFPG